MRLVFAVDYENPLNGYSRGSVNWILQLSERDAREEKTGGVIKEGLRDTDKLKL